MLKIGRGDALRFAVIKVKDGYRLDVQVVLVARPLTKSIPFVGESEMWSGLADVALDPESTVLHGLQVMAGRERGTYSLGLAATDGQVGKEDHAGLGEPEEARLRSAIHRQEGKSTEAWPAT
jgi:hypothetical protein